MGGVPLAPTENIPSWARQGQLFSITNTGRGLSALRERFIPEGIICKERETGSIKDKRTLGLFLDRI